MPSKHEKELYDLLDSLRNMAADENAAYLNTDELYHTLCNVECAMERIAITTLLTRTLESTQQIAGDTETMVILRNLVCKSITPLLKTKTFQINTITETIVHLLAGLHETKKSRLEKEEREYVDKTMERLNRCIKLTTIQQCYINASATLHAPAPPPTRPWPKPDPLPFRHVFTPR
jgi:hypothetical protein